jgi:aminoglycoside phosphotransferase (APT) family kinase protein
MDFGHLLARWDEPGEAPTSLGSSDVANRSWMITRAEMAELYAHLTGFDLSNIRYYEVVSLFKLACIMEGHHANAIKTGGGDPAASPHADVAPKLMVDAWRIAQGDR